jgi:hypothetical protein
MAAGTHDEKLSAQFDVFDRTGDGVLTRDDFEAKAFDVLREFSVPPQDDQGSCLVNAARGFWEGLCDRAGISPDARMTKSEFVEVSTRVLVRNPIGFHELVAPWVLAELNIADRNGDRTLDPEEWARLLRTRGHDDVAIKERLNAADLDSDGRASVHEVLSAAYRFYLDVAPGDRSAALD